ncbi:MAG: sugar phosphate nucleotidyltransferase [Chloroflexi bacterium]|nr:sugar phosphate nucleotidyltransferase [Chloroflexota bacterium]
MIGIVLAGGSGTRLAPLTFLANKHALPLGNVPMIHHAIDLLAKIGITRAIMVCGDSDAAKFMRYLKDGAAFGVSLSYTYQDRPGGIAEALGLCRAFAGGDKAFVILADNGVQYVDTLARAVRELGHTDQWRQAAVFTTRVEHPEHYGVVKLDDRGSVQAILEKPKNPPSHLAVTGFYLYPPDVFDILPTLVLSQRGELEITDVNNYYLRDGRLSMYELDGFWWDAGESLEQYQAMHQYVLEYGANHWQHPEPGL